ncbi:hypothetical protein [Streptomyces sp. V4I23]|uniref:hypothetical protein n=1 Tax=Streptomyces sp. V4I23 TaxID=3042282 RepID=UPI0027D774D3|nr:hypothetical protein [Streptomyces sp. V4I23]
MTTIDASRAALVPMGRIVSRATTGTTWSSPRTMAGLTAGEHRASVTLGFPRIGGVTDTATVVDRLTGP